MAHVDVLPARSVLARYSWQAGFQPEFLLQRATSFVRLLAAQLVGQRSPGLLVLFAEQQFRAMQEASNSYQATLAGARVLAACKAIHSFRSDSDSVDPFYCDISLWTCFWEYRVAEHGLMQVADSDVELVDTLEALQQSAQAQFAELLEGQAELVLPARLQELAEQLGLREPLELIPDRTDTKPGLMAEWVRHIVEEAMDDTLVETETHTVERESTGTGSVLVKAGTEEHDAEADLVMKESEKPRIHGTL